MSEVKIDVVGIEIDEDEKILNIIATPYKKSPGDQLKIGEIIPVWKSFLIMGVKEEMKFAIVTKGDINDPDSGKHLGTIDLVIARVQIKEIYEKFSIAENYQFTRSAGFIATSALLESLFPISTRVPIAVFDSSIKFKKVKKGDIARQILTAAQIIDSE